MNKIKAIIFDLGRVVIKIDDIEARKKKFLKDYDLDEEVLRENLIAYEVGNISTDDFFDELQKHTKTSDTKLREEFLSMLLGKNQNTVRLIKDLKKRKYKVACLSNTIDIHWEYIKNEYRILDLFDEKIASHIVGIAKPDLKIYKHTLRLLDIEPQESVFIDDLEENIAAADSLGMKGILFNNDLHDISELQDSLVKYGVEIDRAVSEDEV